MSYYKCTDKYNFILKYMRSWSAKRQAKHFTRTYTFSWAGPGLIWRECECMRGLQTLSKLKTIH